MREGTSDLRRARWNVIAATGAVLLAGVFAASAPAAEITLTSLADEVPVTQNGVCTLREAINKANTNSPSGGDCRFTGTLGHETINLPAGTLTIAGGGSSDNANTGGDFDIAMDNANHLTINGAPSGTTIDANAIDRIFDQVPIGTSSLGSRVLTLRDLTLTGGDSGSGGGGIRFEADLQESGLLDLQRVNVVDNQTFAGGGGGVVVRGAVLKLTDSHIDGNTLNGPTTQSFGGGVAVFPGTSSDIGIQAVRSTINDNLYNATSGLYGTFRRGGGLHLGLNETADEPSTFVDGEISGNELSVDSGGAIATGAAVNANNHSFVMRRSTISGNSITGTSPNTQMSAGLHAWDDSETANNVYTLENVTVSGNNSTPNPNVADTGPGGVFLQGGINTIVNSTIAGNTATGTGNRGTQMSVWGGSVPGSGTLNQAGDSTTLHGNIFSGAGACFLSGPGNGGSPAMAFSHSYNLESPGNTCFLTGGAGGTPGPTGDRVGVTPALLNLGPLADNGGPGPTHALLPASLAIDAIPAADCLDAADDPLETDERGLQRPGGAGCDIGAFEAAQCLASDITETGTAGNDTIEGTDGVDVIAALGGNDTVRGLGGNDKVCAGDGDDTIEGGDGDDQIEGGDGSDTIEFRNATAAVGVSLDAGSSSGGAGSDTFTGAENLVGSAHADNLAGSSAPNVVTGGPGGDTISTLAGADTIFARDSAADNVACGDDADTVESDQAGVDTLAADCETQDLAPAVEEPGPQPPGPQPPQQPQGQSGNPPAKKKCKKAKKGKKKKCKKRKRGKRR